MFQEHNEMPDHKSGWIEVIAGSMFSGKTEELLRRARRAEIAKLSVQLFKPGIDKRYANDEVVSHDRTALSAIAVESSAQLGLLAQGYDVVGLDEAQFFDSGIVQVVNDLANAGTRIIIAGLDMDFSGKPFGPMPDLMATAEFVTKVHAICMHSGKLAHHSHRVIDDNKEQIMLGEIEEYEPVSRSVFHQINQEKKSV